MNAIERAGLACNIMILALSATLAAGHIIDGSLMSAGGPGLVALVLIVLYRFARFIARDIRISQTETDR